MQVLTLYLQQISILSQVDVDMFARFRWFSQTVRTAYNPTAGIECLYDPRSPLLPATQATLMSYMSPMVVCFLCVAHRRWLYFQRFEGLQDGSGALDLHLVSSCSFFDVQGCSNMLVYMTTLSPLVCKCFIVVPGYLFQPMRQILS